MSRLKGLISTGLRVYELVAREQERQERAEQSAENRWYQQQQLEYQERMEPVNREADDRAKELHAIQLQRYREEAAGEERARRLVEAQFSSAITSRQLGHARFATLADARKLGLCDSAGLFLGILDGHGIYYNGDRHLTTFAGTRTGKGRELILPALGLYKQRSVVVTDVKDGENAYSSAHHRYHNLKQPVVFLNPKGLYGLPTARVNPCDPVIHARDDDKFNKAGSVASVLAPVVDPEADKAWVNEGVALILRCFIAHLAAVDPLQCTLGTVWEMLTGNEEHVRRNLQWLAGSPLPTVARYADVLVGFMKAVSQWKAYEAALSRSLQAFGPESAYTKATSASDFDARQITQTHHTAYIMMPRDDMAENALWVSLMVNHFIRTSAANPGPVKTLFLLDEFNQLPPIPHILECVNMNAGKGQQFWFFAHDRNALESKYGEVGALQFGRQSGIVQAWQMRDIELMKEYEYLGGRTSINVAGTNVSEGSRLSVSLGVTEQARNLIQPEDLRLADEDEQFVIPHQGPIIKARLWPWDRIAGIRQTLRDPRQAQFGHILPPLNTPPVTASDYAD